MSFNAILRELYTKIWIYFDSFDVTLLMKLKARESKLTFFMYVIQLSCEIELLEFPGLATSGANVALVEYGVSKQ